VGDISLHPHLIWEGFAYLAAVMDLLPGMRIVGYGDRRGLCAANFLVAEVFCAWQSEISQ
jgi:hypothetical protein